MKRFCSFVILALILIITPSAVIAAEDGVNVKYKAHVAEKGWIEPAVELGRPIGTTGENKQLECVEFTSDSLPEGVQFRARAHVSNLGWQDFITNNGQIGTTGQGLGIEAVEMKLDGSSSNDIYYRSHVSGIGWLDWAKNGETSGTVGYGLPIESIEVKVVPAGTEAPGDTSNASYDQSAIANLGFLTAKLIRIKS